MAQTAIIIRMDSDLKAKFDALCDEFGMSTNTAFNIFARTVVRNRRIPFTIEAPAKENAVEKGKASFDELRQIAAENGLAGMSLEEINEEIRLTRESMKTKYTPEFITKLLPDEVFVFGSNLDGLHGEGAARVALHKFGARWGQGVGLQGQSYAIPTMQGGVETIRPYVDEFIAFAQAHPGLTFYVTRIGCGIAGFADDEIAPLFRKARDVKNIILPKSFIECIEK